MRCFLVALALLAVSCATRTALEQDHHVDHERYERPAEPQIAQEPQVLSVPPQLFCQPQEPSWSAHVERMSNTPKTPDCFRVRFSGDENTIDALALAIDDRILGSQSETRSQTAESTSRELQVCAPPAKGLRTISVKRHGLSIEAVSLPALQNQLASIISANHTQGAAPCVAVPRITRPSLVSLTLAGQRTPLAFRSPEQCAGENSATQCYAVQFLPADRMACATTSAPQECEARLQQLTIEGLMTVGLFAVAYAKTPIALKNLADVVNAKPDWMERASFEVSAAFHFQTWAPFAVEELGPAWAIPSGKLAWVQPQGTEPRSMRYPGRKPHDKCVAQFSSDSYLWRCPGPSHASELPYGPPLDPHAEYDFAHLDHVKSANEIAIWRSFSPSWKEARQTVDYWIGLHYAPLDRKLCKTFPAVAQCLEKLTALNRKYADKRATVLFILGGKSVNAIETEAELRALYPRIDSAFRATLLAYFATRAAPQAGESRAPNFGDLQVTARKRGYAISWYAAGSGGSLWIALSGKVSNQPAELRCVAFSQAPAWLRTALANQRPGGRVCESEDGSWTGSYSVGHCPCSFTAFAADDIQASCAPCMRRSDD